MFALSLVTLSGTTTVSVHFTLLTFQTLGNPLSDVRVHIGHTKQSAMSLTVARLLRWDCPCKCRNTRFLSCGRMYGLGEPNLTSQYSVLLLKGAGNFWSAKEVSDNTLGSVESHFFSSAIKSSLRMSLSTALSSVLESVSVTVWFSPFTYRRSVVNNEM